jgi:glycosyl transferase family 25
MEEQLDRLCVDYEFVPAVDGSKLTQEQKARYSARRARWTFGRQISPGEIGCSMTPALLYERMVREEIEEVLILEDDVIITQDLLEVLRRRHSLPEDWQLVNFDLRPYRVLGKSKIFVKPLGEPVWKDYRACMFERVSAGTAAYLINLAGAKRLLQSVWPICLPPDVFLGRADMSKAIVYGVDPPAVELAKLGSEIYRIDQRPRWQNTKVRSKKLLKVTRYLHPAYLLSAVRREIYFGLQRLKGRPYWSTGQGAGGDVS